MRHALDLATPYCAVASAAFSPSAILRANLDESIFGRRETRGRRMDAASIAVIGTLGGVALTALASLLSARLTVNSQRAAAAAQRLHDARNKLRDERRAAFVSYLSAYQALNSRAVEMIEASPTQAGSGRFGDKERNAFSRAYQELLITAERPETIEAARAATATLWDMVRAVSSGVDAFREAEERSRAPRRRLRAEMRDELNSG